MSSDSLPSLCEVGRSLLEKTEALKKTVMESKMPVVEGGTTAENQNPGLFQSILNSGSVQNVLHQVQDTTNNIMSKSLSENAENLKNNITENYENVKGMVHDAKNTAVELKDNILNKSIAENAEALKSTVSNNYENIKSSVEQAANASADIRKRVLENVENVTNSVQESETYKKMSELSEKDIRKTMEDVGVKAQDFTKKVMENVEDVKNSVKESETYKKISDLAEKEIVRKTVEDVTAKAQDLRKQVTPLVDRFLEGPDRNSPPLDKSLISALYFLRDLIWIWLLSFPIFFKTLIGKFTTKKEKDLKDKVVVVTGAGNGLGKEMAFQFAKLGCKVACVDVSYEANKETALSIIYSTGKKDVVKSYGCDVSKPEEVKKLAEDVVKDFGGVDILVNNAGILYGHEICGGSNDAIKKVIDVNLLGNFWMVREFLPLMKEKKSGHIVFTNSASGIVAVGNASSYSASKFGLLGLAYSLDDELRRNPEFDNIKVTSVHPYFVVTNPEFAKNWRLRIPPMEVTEAVSQIITGIRREYFTFQVPNLDLGYLMSSIMRMLPLELFRIVKNVLYVDILLNKDGTTLTSTEMNAKKA